MYTLTNVTACFRLFLLLVESDHCFGQWQCTLDDSSQTLLDRIVGHTQCVLMNTRAADEC